MSRAFYNCMRIMKLPQNRLHIRLNRGYRRDVEVFNQEVEHIGGDESRQRWSELDVLDAEVEQGQEDYNRFLLVPGEDHRERQVVDAAFESACQGHCYLDGRVGVVALTYICLLYTSDAADE